MAPERTIGTAAGPAATYAVGTNAPVSDVPGPRRELARRPSPLLGTFYRSPKPGAPPFVEVGAKVEEDTVIAIIEVMKLMNTVRAGTRGTVTDIFAAGWRPRGIRPATHPSAQIGVAAVPIRRILIANRGEIAARVIRTCRTLGIETVLATSIADRDSVPARMADRAVCIGPARPTDSYLKVETIVHAALATKCDAIHPGYGFLSERAQLARTCEEEGVIFIGPTATQIDAVGDKLRARAEAEGAKVPVVPGGSVSSADEAMALGGKIGVPLLVKAVGGGGGRGMKRVNQLSDLAAAVELASAEAGAAFGDARVYLERYVETGRHVEVQVLRRWSR